MLDTNFEGFRSKLERDIAAVIRKNSAVTEDPFDAALSLLGAAACVIAAIDSPDCRKVMAANAVKTFPEIVDGALQFAARHFDPDPLPGCVH